MVLSDYETVKSLVKTLEGFGVMSRKEKKKILGTAKSKYENFKLKTLVNSFGGNNDN